MTIKAKRKAILILVLMVAATVALSIWGSKVDIQPIASAIQKAGIWAPLLYILILAAPMIIAPLSGTPIFVAGFILFGGWVQLYAYLAFLFASVVNFYVSRKWGRGIVIKLVGKEDMHKVDNFTKDYGVVALIFLRLMQGPLSDYISYAYGLTNMKFIPYMIVNIITPIPWMLLWYLFILPKIHSVNDFSLWFLITLIPFLIISWFYWRYKFGKK